MTGTTNKVNERSATIALILGGSLNAARRQAAVRGEKPRVDVMEMERAFGAELYDYSWLEQRATQERISRFLVSLAKRRGHWSEFLTLRAVWSARRKDVIYATGEDVGLPMAFLLRLFGWTRPRLILRMEQPAFGRNRIRRFLYLSILRLSVPRIHTILCRTQAHVDYLRNRVNITNTRVVFAPESTDSTFFHRSQPVRHFVSTANLSRPYLMSAGLEERDYDTLISAVRDLPVTALICAGSPWAKVHYNPAQDRLPENVVVRSFNAQEMRELYRSASFVVLPIKPTQRACGMNVVLEAWAMARGVIATCTEGLSSYIHHQQTGYLVSPENVEELRRAILYLLANPQEAERLGRAGHELIEKNLHLECYLDTVRSVIDELMKEAR